MRLAYALRKGGHAMIKFARLVSAAALVGLSPGIAVAESENVLDYKTGDPADWPAELDAVVAAPDNHKILLENDRVRMLEVTLLPDTVEPLHSHQWPSVLYIMEAGDFTDSDMDGNVIFDTRELPEPLLPVGDVERTGSPAQRRQSEQDGEDPSYSGRTEAIAAV